MKYLLTAIVVFACLLSQAQINPEKICGIWKLSQSAYDGQFSDSSLNVKKRYKIITPSYFTVIDINAKTNVTETNIFGKYTFDHGVYTENLLNVTEDAKSMIGRKFSFTIRFEGENTFVQLGSFNGMQTQEKWIRVLSAD